MNPAEGTTTPAPTSPKPPGHVAATLFIEDPTGVIGQRELGQDFGASKVNHGIQPDLERTDPGPDA